jgi:hypothetical protein
MSRLSIPCLALLGAIVLSLACPPAAAVDDLSVKMWYPDTVRRGQETGVSLEIVNENYQDPVNITWTGIHIDWMSPGEFAYNTSQFILRGGQSRIVNITFNVPGNAKAGLRSNYEVIRYGLQNGTNGDWSDATWESVITKDIKVVVDKPSQDWYSWATNNMFTVCTVVIVIIVIVTVARVAIRRMARGRWRGRIDDTVTLRPSSSPPTGYKDPKFPPAPYDAPKPTKEDEPESQPEPDAVQTPKPASPPPSPRPAVIQMSKPNVPDRGVDLMTPTDWSKVGADISSGPETSEPPKNAPDMGPKFCTYCGMAEPGPVCRNCGRRLV